MRWLDTAFLSAASAAHNPRAEARYTKRRQVAALHIFSISQYKLLSLIAMGFALPKNKSPIALLASCKPQKMNIACFACNIQAAV